MITKQWFALGITSVAVIALGLYTSLHTTPASADTLVTEDNAVLLPDQPSSDETVVPYVKLSQPGYVIIYTTATTTTTGTKTVLGQSDLLSAGEHRNVHVHHNNGTKPADGSTVSATIVADNGDGVYSGTDDTDVLLPEDQTPTADISDDAVVDTAPTDEELTSELEDAGYDVTDNTQDTITTPDTTSDEDSDDASSTPADDDMPQDQDATVQDESTTSVDTTDATDTSDATSTDTTEVETQES